MADARVSVLIDLKSKLQGLEKAQVGFKSLIKLALGFTATYLSLRSTINGAKDIISLGAELDHLKSRTGESASSILTFRQALEDAGIEAKSGEQALDRLTRRVRLAIGQNNSYAKALKELNLDPQVINNMGKLERFQTVAEALRNTSDESLKTQAAMELLDTSAGQLFALIDNPDAFGDAATSIGHLGEIMDRNSVSFERMDTLMGHFKNKARQIFAGIGDIIADDLLGPLESLNQMDFSSIGQKIGGFLQVGINSFKDGTFSDFIGLSIEAGFEQGMSAARKLWDSLFQSDGDLWKSAVNGVLTLGTKIDEVLLNAFQNPIAYLSAGMRWAASQMRYGFEVAINAISSGFGSIINFVASGFESLLNKIITQVNAITEALPFTDGTHFSALSLGRVSWGNGDVEDPAQYGDLLNQQKSGISAISEAVKGRLNKSLETTRDLLGIGSDETKDQETATQRLNNLIQEQIDLREQAADASDARPKPLAGGNTQTEGSFPQEQTFAQTSNDQYQKYSSGIGDFGVGTIAAAKAALQDYVVQAGTGAQQIHEQLDSIADGLQDSIGSSITGLLNQTMSWGNALQNVGSGIINSVIGSFSDMAAAWITKQVMMFALGQKLKAADSATTAAKGAADAAAMAPAAATASIASFGTAAAIGLAAVVAAMAMFGGFSGGGYTGPGGVLKPAGIVHAGEDVFSQANIALWGSGREGLRTVEMLRAHGPRALPTLYNKYTPESAASNLRVRYPGYSGGGVVGSNMDLSGIQNEVAQSFSQPAEKQQRQVEAFLFHDKRSRDEILASPELEDAVLRIIELNA
jgi:hypothetical protein